MGREIIGLLSVFPEISTTLRPTVGTHSPLCHLLPRNPGPVDKGRPPESHEGVNRGGKNYLIFSHSFILHDIISQSDIQSLHFSNKLVKGNYSRRAKL